MHAEKLDEHFATPVLARGIHKLSHSVERGRSRCRAGCAGEARSNARGTARAREDGSRARVRRRDRAFYAETTLDVRSRAFADSMRHLTARYPKDLEAAAFASLAIQIADPRGANRDEAIALAERVMRESPNHPGAVHYLIHATDAPAYAARGLAAARAYAKVAPDAEHAQHMPSHIFLQLGLWDDAAASNERAWKASRDWVKRRGASGADLDFHDLQWLQYMYLQQGRYALARSIIDTARAVLAGVDLSAPEHADAQYVIATLAFQYGAEGVGLATDAIRSEPPTPGPSASHRAQFFAMMATYQRALAAAATGDTASGVEGRRAIPRIADSIGPSVPTGSDVGRGRSKRL